MRQHALLVLGGAAWAGAFAGWVAAASGRHGWLLGGLVATLLVPAVARGRGRWPACLVAAGVLAGAIASTSYVAGSRPAELQEWAADGVEVTVSGRVAAARVQPAGDIGSREGTRLTVIVDQFRRGEAAIPVRTPVVVVGDRSVLGLPARGSRITVTGTLLPRPGLRDPGFTIPAASLGPVAPPSGWDAAVAAARTRMWQALDSIDVDAASLTAGLAIGDDSRQSAALHQSMRRSGLSHLTAVSGGNVAIILGVVLGAAALLAAPLRARLALGLGAILAYAGFVGPEPSVLRAAAMGSIAVVGLMRGARGGGSALLGLAVLALLVVRPSLAVSWGFGLSVAATLGILMLAAPMDRWLAARLPSLRGSFVAAVSVTMAAQAATAPLLAAMTGTLSLASIPANLLAAPLVAPITVLGLAVTLLAGPAPSVAALVAYLVQPFALLLARLASWAADLPAAVIDVPGGAPGGVLVASCLGGATALLRRFGAAPALALLLLLCAAVAGSQRQPDPPADWVAAACDIGQGDAYLLRTGHDSAVLIDTGPGSDDLLGCLQDMGVQRIALLVLTHFDTDHVAAAGTVLRRYRPATVLVSPVAEPAENAAAVRRAAQATGTAVAEARPGLRLAVGTAEITVVWPRRVITGGSVSNNAAVALDVRAAGLQLLFTGDLEHLGQAGLMSSYPAGQFDVATIPHHGSADQEPGFARWTGAAAMWVSAGRGNRFGHPTPEALALAREAGAVVARTDRDGTVVLVERDGRPVLQRLGPAP